MRRLFSTATLLLILGLALAGCGESSKPAATVTMTATAFGQNIITLKAGDQLAITDPSNGARQVLYFGNVGQYIANRNGPSELNTAQGVEFTPGISKTFTFAKAGVYEVTSALHPKMNLLITVK
ncbi:MAG TPA: hypothetical protein VF812_01195 [Ktedonobacterales bacterium]